MKQIPGSIIEIFCINLKPGTGRAFHQLYVEQSLPLQKEWGVNVVAFGPSLHNEDSYLVARQYKDLDDRRQSQDSFYSSDKWKQGPREAILSFIENYTTVVVPVNDDLLEGLKQLNLTANK